MANLLERFENSGQAITVQMNETRFVTFQQYQAIGTRNLNSCSVVIVASTSGAVLAHISPLSHQTDDPHAGDNHVRAMMRQVQSLVNHYRSSGYFPQSENLIVCAVYQGQIALPSQVTIMQQALAALGVVPSIRTYIVPTNLQNPAQGTVIVIAHEGQPPVIYIEDVPQNCTFYS